MTRISSPDGKNSSSLWDVEFSPCAGFGWDGVNFEGKHYVGMGLHCQLPHSVPEESQMLQLGAASTGPVYAT